MVYPKNQNASLAYPPPGISVTYSGDAGWGEFAIAPAQKNTLPEMASRVTEKW